jgi:hypothetical protein
LAVLSPWLQLHLVRCSWPVIPCFPAWTCLCSKCCQLVLAPGEKEGNSQKKG